MFRVIARVPEGTNVLEVGSGHGVFALLAIEAGARRVTAVEPDLRKIMTLASANRTGPEGPVVHVVAGYDEAIGGRFDVVAMIDVLYAIDKSQWDAVLARLSRRVAPGGVLLLKEMDPTSRVKSVWNRIQETIAIRVLRLTLAETITFDTPPQMVTRLRRAGFSSVEIVPIDRGYPHPHLLYVAQRAKLGTQRPAAER